MSDAVVIGGGFAGLSAGVALARAGLRVTVLEARGHLGGRATAFRDRHTGELVDNGQHVLFGCYRETLAFLAVIGARDRLHMPGSLAVPMIDDRGRRTTFRCPDLPAPWHLVGGILEWDALELEDRLASFRLSRPLQVARRALDGRGRGLAASPGETVENWLIRNGQTARLRKMLWEPLALAALNQSPRVAAAPPFVRVLAGMFGGDRRDSAVGLPLRPLNELYAEPARAYIEARGGSVRTGAPARVAVTGGRASAIVRDEPVPAGAIIAAVPWHALPELFQPPPPELAPVIAAAAGTASSPLATVNLWMDRAVLNTPILGLPGRRLQWVFDKRLAFGGDASHLSMVASGADDLITLTNDELIAAALGELVDALPEARQARLVRATVVREPRGTFSLAPGQPARPGTATAVANLFLAGDWIDTGLPATIEGAVASGGSAASAAARYLTGTRAFEPVA